MSYGSNWIVGFRQKKTSKPESKRGTKLVVFLFSFFKPRSIIYEKVREDRYSSVNQA